MFWKKILVLLYCSLCVIFAFKIYDVKAYYSIDSYYVPTFTVYQPVSQVYITTSSYIHIHDDDPLLPGVVIREPSNSFASMTYALSSSVGGYNYTGHVHDLPIVYDGATVLYYMEYSTFANYDSADGDETLRFVMTYDNISTITTNALAIAESEAQSAFFNPALFLSSVESYNNGFDDGKEFSLQSLIDAWEIDMAEAIQVAEDAADAVGYQRGYGEGVNANVSETLNFPQMLSYFFATFNILNLEILPNVTMGMIVSVPLILGLMGFLFGVSTMAFSSTVHMNQSATKKAGKKK